MKRVSPLGLPLGALSEVEGRRAASRARDDDVLIDGLRHCRSNQNQRQHHHQFKEGEACRASLFSRIASVIHGLPLTAAIAKSTMLDWPTFARFARLGHAGYPFAKSQTQKCPVLRYVRNQRFGLASGGSWNGGISNGSENAEAGRGLSLPSEKNFAR